MFTFSFTAKNPDAVKAARLYAAQRVTRITEQTRSAIRALTVRSIQDGIAPRELGRMLKSVVGLTPRYAHAVANYRRELRDAGVAYEKRIVKVEKYAAKLLKSRATTIARTELKDALERGQLDNWRSWQSQTGDVITREWITADPCEVCAPMNGQRRLLNEQFLTGKGDLIWGPTAHPNCECAVGIVSVISGSNSVRRKHGR